MAKSRRPFMRLRAARVALSGLVPPKLPPVDELHETPTVLASEPHPRYQFENLAFEGGGAKAIAYCGAVGVLEEEGIYPRHVRRVAGTSSGSFLAALLAVGCSSEQMLGMLSQIDLSSLMRDARWGKLGALRNIFSFYGFNPGARLTHHLGELLDDHTGSADVTFRQVLERCGRELCIPITNITRMSTEYCHPKTTPDLPVRLAVGISMSLPVMMQPYRLVRRIGNPGWEEEDLYTDGGLLCNYPLHVFDGWWLSMAPQDSFIQRMRPLSRVADYYHHHKRFHPANDRTLGFTVFDNTDVDVTADWATERGGERPDTRLARARAAQEARAAERCELSTELEDAFQRLLDAMAQVERDGDGRVSRAECQRLFDSGAMSTHDAELLFGTSEVGKVFDALDVNGDDHVSFDEILRFMDAMNLDLTARAMGYGRRESPSVTNFMSNVFHTMLVHVRRLNLKPEDDLRTVPIDTDYIRTADFLLEEGDRAFLLEAGARATRAFLRQHAERSGG